MSVTWRIVAKELSSSQLEAWLENYRATLNPNRFIRDKAEAFAAELSSRT
ncbi:gp224 [Mycobacterium phage Omega]|uniref:Uncharacterized protein n=1 Tax=Mycobacterium phage Omega TaxID=2907835 RepID=Q853U3_BPMOM|nr:gp224 [Mycobacterium phage Omega]AAN12865.1 hypothetical protein PBI_OMEGA_224 [Mycobacterium phage Omega]AWH14033.1 hypothetical protein SEA_HALLEY_225 [Mycobacterium phage Halley]